LRHRSVSIWQNRSTPVHEECRARSQAHWIYMATSVLHQNGKSPFNRDTISNRRKWSWPLSISIEICIVGICHLAGCLLGGSEATTSPFVPRHRSYKILSSQKEPVQEAVIFKITAFFLKCYIHIGQKEFSVSFQKTSSIKYILNISLSRNFM